MLPMQSRSIETFCYWTAFCKYTISDWDLKEECKLVHSEPVGFGYRGEICVIATFGTFIITNSSATTGTQTFLGEPCLSWKSEDCRLRTCDKFSGHQIWSKVTLKVEKYKYRSFSALPVYRDWEYLQSVNGFWNDFLNVASPKINSKLDCGMCFWGRTNQTFKLKLFLKRGHSWEKVEN